MMRYPNHYVICMKAAVSTGQCIRLRVPVFSGGADWVMGAQTYPPSEGLSAPFLVSDDHRLDQVGFYFVLPHLYANLTMQPCSVGGPEQTLTL